MTSLVDLETASKVLDSSFAFYLVETDVYAIAFEPSSIDIVPISACGYAKA